MHAPFIQGWTRDVYEAGLSQLSSTQSVIEPGFAQTDWSVFLLGPASEIVGVKRQHGEVVAGDSESLTIFEVV